MDKTLYNLYLRNIKDNIKDINDLLNNSNSNNKLKEIEKINIELKSEWDLFQLEYKRLYTKSEDPTVLSLKNEYQTLQKRIKELNDKNQLDRLLEYERNGTGSDSYILRNPNRQEQQQLDRVKQCKVVADNGTKMLKEAVSMLHQDIQVMSDTMIEMKAQRERLERIDKKFDNIDAKIEVSSKLIKKMS
ncbi:hypothetical protein PPL_02917 [Heterostelium album PN500]|uniref:t-SNARE coiled-coil homology domain-containing protein n=1 Tax=Heterostelium pallidum (strain ATCC 26659 / Pp 5 / PN500) TaxID=670386 RepID=D3B3E9_HETP5|nr:hypothetical protein PPL_02917 [Heterostelium album PN500]EFA83847.1 hypothetical protein PPL_02917 [Heterostelium album PN500]|eukprot:XP_020435964.1 hypothetical protein PPL_02917 [Heterostelium album PN500]